MTNFQIACAFTLRDDIEGGYVFNKHDSGGETNHGITDKRDGVVDGKADLDGDGKGDVSIKDLTTPQSMVVYEREYWNRYNLSKLSMPLAVVAFDCYVNHRPDVASRLLQQSGGDWKKMIQLRKDFFGLLAKKKPDQERFLKGWLNRANKLWTYCHIIDLQ